MMMVDDDSRKTGRQFVNDNCQLEGRGQRAGGALGEDLLQIDMIHTGMNEPESRSSSNEGKNDWQTITAAIQSASVL